MPKSEKKEILSIGGQAVIEGVMMRTKDKVAVAVRTPKGGIATRDIPLKYGPIKKKLVKIPFFRGIIFLAETMTVGFKAIQFSASASTGEKEETGSSEMTIAMTVALLFGVGLFIAAPFFLTKLIHPGDGVIFNLIDGFFRIAIFVGYLLFISMFKDIRTLFQYHGGEHMTVAAFEAGEKLDPKHIRKYSRLHPRCGTNFLLIVLIVSILVFSVATPPPLKLAVDPTILKILDGIFKVLIRIALFPVIAGIAYEALKFGGRHHKNPIVSVFVYPGLLLQEITTKKPTDKQIEVAIAALKQALK